MTSWRVATATAIITPDDPVVLGGYADRVGLSTGVHDDLEVNVLVLADAADRCLAWASIDALAVTPALRTCVESAVTGLTGCAEVLVAASHTHSAPVGWVGEILPALPAEVDDSQLRQIEAAIRGAKPTRQTARVETFSTRITGVGANRTTVDGPYDDSASGLVVKAEDDRVLAICYDFACHPTVLGPDNLEISADWVGAARHALRIEFGNVPVLYLQGCAGDISTRFTRTAQDFAECTRLGEGVASQLIPAIHSARPLTGDGLQIHRETLVLPSRWTPGTAVDLPISAVGIGYRHWLCVADEVVASHGLRLHAAHPGTRLVSCVDGYIGYLSDQRGHLAHSYEAQSSPLGLAETTAVFDRLAEIAAEPNR